MIDRRLLLGGALSLASTSLAGCYRGKMATAADGPRRLYEHEGQAISADVVVYGATPAGVMAALEVAESRASVVIIGGWREAHVGGMMSGGLGWTDFLDAKAFGGAALRTIKAVSRGGGEAGNRFSFKPSAAEAYFEYMLALKQVSVVYSRGVVGVAKTDRRITGFETADGLRVTGRVFVDASYEGDLLAAAGVGFQVGREAASPLNNLGGYRGATREGETSTHQFQIRGRSIVVDPFQRPGDQASGLLRGVAPGDQKPVGAADKAVQAYNFRLTMSNRPGLRIDLPSTPPPGYDRADYEVLFRYVAAIGQAGLKHGVDWSFADDLIYANDLGDGYFDVNARGGFSTDPVLLSWAYPTASYAEREVIWKRHESFIRGFFYALAWEKDARLPASLQQEVRQWGLAKDHYARPHANDSAGWPYQLYVREARRLDNGAMWSAADLDKDGAPRLSRAVALASYRQDSHLVQRIAVKGEHGWTIWNEGNFEQNSGGRDQRSILPLDIMLPHRDQATNLLAPFAVAASHQAFSAIRMEMTSMTLGQAAGAAAAMLCAPTRQADVQDVDYRTLREILVADGVVLDERNAVGMAELRGEQLIRKIKRRLG
jgi:hypothetical protein